VFGIRQWLDAGHDINSGPMLLLSVLETLQDESRHEAEETLGVVCEAPPLLVERHALAGPRTELLPLLPPPPTAQQLRSLPPSTFCKQKTVDPALARRDSTGFPLSASR
jgi:hypothetical protein